jgi:hypothetical protein
VEASPTADVDLLRHALASVWTELEKDTPDLGGCQRVIDEALRMTPARPGKDVTHCGVGVEGWDEYMESVHGRIRREGG